jgi:DNA-binding MarR family transcriptional regulator/ribosomal protein S18 acetylase RimI-like enzyme
MLTIASMDDIIAGVRRFNRFYTQKIGVLGEGLADTQLSLTEARVLYELAHGEQAATAASLSQLLTLDPGYLSRILQGFERKKIVARKPSPQDRREMFLTLTPAGRKVFAALDRRTVQDLRKMLAPVPEAARVRLSAAMQTIRSVLGDPPKQSPTPYILRPPRPGDFGWVVEAHGRLYAAEYNWDQTFEGFVAGIVAKFIENFDSKRERCWIAERDGENVGSVFVVKESSTQAKLRMLIVDPKARGLGVGQRLVEECIRFASDAGYRKMTLFTVSQLQSARRIYEAAGFQLVNEHPTHSWGHDVVDQTWELDLRCLGSRQPPGRRHSQR